MYFMLNTRCGTWQPGPLSMPPQGTRKGHGESIPMDIASILPSRPRVPARVRSPAAPGYPQGAPLPYTRWPSPVTTCMVGVPLTDTLGPRVLAQAGFFLREHLVDESVLHCLLCGEEVVTVGI